jgi:hypothetical protein
VGYGDLTPTTGGGRFLAVCIMFSGTLLLSLPVGVIGSNFLEVYKDRKARNTEKNDLKPSLTNNLINSFKHHNSTPGDKLEEINDRGEL